ncbi:MAG: transcription-repair coupling factor, partial [Solirubrobacterales bacterium]|nr:transcription-repair coupling factor [Solirubrobacterales bacterium]
VTPVDLVSAQVTALKEQLPGALYEPGRSQLSIKVSNDPGKRFPAVVRAADVLLAVTRLGA